MANHPEIPFSKINPAPYNPRQRLTPGDHEYQTIKNSVQEFGLVESSSGTSARQFGLRPHPS
jgi:ParB-like chromosome segregation protein Spo0J